MREYVRQFVNYQEKTTSTNLLTGATSVSLNPHKDWLLTRSNGRSDPISTTPSGGGYHVPTAYFATRYGHDIINDERTEEQWWGTHSPCSSTLTVHSFHVTSGLTPHLLGPEFTGVLTTVPVNPWFKRYIYLPDTPGYLESRVIDQLNSRIQQNSWEVSQSLGEMPETVELLLSASRRLLLAYKYAKQGRMVKALYTLGVDPKRAKKTVRGKISGSILEFQYGWKPLMQEIHSLATAIEEGLKQPVSKPITVELSEEFDLSDSYPEGFLQWTHSGSGRFIVKAGIEARVNSDFLTKLGSHGLTNPASLAWELFPLSFVIDWFVPIGSFLSGLSTPIGVSFEDGYLTKKAEWERRSTVSPMDTSYVCESNDRTFHIVGGVGGHRYGANQSHVEWYEGFQRELLPFPPPPVPYWDPKLNISKIASIGTLLVALTSG